jgi:hypothetical protein
MTTTQVATETVRTETTKTTPIKTTTEIGNISLGSPVVLRTGIPFLMTLGFPFILAIFLLRRRESEVVVDYDILSSLYTRGLLPRASSMFRFAMTDVTLLRVMADTELFNAIQRVHFNVYPSSSEEIANALSLSPDPEIVERFLARSLASRLDTDLLSEMLYGR